MRDNKKAPRPILDWGIRTRYNLDMTVEQLRKMHRAQPFRPFEIHLAEGRALGVRHPEFLAINPPGRTVAVAVEDGTIEIVDLLLVTSLKPQPDGARRRATRKKRTE